MLRPRPTTARTNTPPAAELSAQLRALHDALASAARLPVSTAVANFLAEVERRIAEVEQAQGRRAA